MSFTAFHTSRQVGICSWVEVVVLHIIACPAPGRLMDEVADPSEYPKSYRRLQAGLQQLLDSPGAIAEVAEMLPTTTYDEQKVEEP